ncbi:hypothetical protein CWB96_19485 [Pseudoalteromonas citrea]|uniref:Uncharacterized protein n=1 Tax=Pseudoalteromonas citrea TaxID=43655 RepID=A0A5S3XKV2_9GAMM|nr:hypothetical protein [Pseudoalteromonas citrea]TMP38797.1 hypothetical protein CWB97_21610 [Pseudoalteromonas citrea]TMP54344.1 hypothetical protein CWB96_19485 [Pseudoalteromonas citrea]
MLLKLNKKKIKTLSQDAAKIPSDMTPGIAGGAQADSSYRTYRCQPNTNLCLTDGPECPGNLTSRAC